MLKGKNPIDINLYYLTRFKFLAILILKIYENNFSDINKRTRGFLGK